MDTKGFFGALFDMSFSTWVTVRIIKVLYWLGLIVLGLMTVMVFLSLAVESAAQAILALILAPIIFLIGAILLRVYLEVIIVLFRIADHTAEIAAASRLPRTETRSEASSE
jgi:formate-dependent nitrite reductase membrane component NrfD